jgi:hypothetical protein
MCVLLLSLRARWSVLNAEADMGPFELLHWANKTMTCPQVPCPGFYSSINFLLLGLIMQHVEMLAAWEDWDQLAVIPEWRRPLCVSIYVTVRVSI